MNKLICFLGAIGIAFSAQAQDHGHLNVGAESQDVGAKLIFANGAAFAIDSSYVKTLTFTNGTVYAGYFQGNTTFTALPATAAFGGPDPQAPAVGSYIQAQIVSVEGPDGGELGFWDTGATSPTIKLKSGETGSQMFRLSESDGSPDSDPYGHIHGRRFTLTKPGLYKVGFRAVDTSTNGPTGGPIHTPSDVLYTYFEAGVNILRIRALTGLTRVSFVAPLASNWQLEAASTLGVPTVWFSVGDPVVGNDLIVTIDEVGGSDPQRYYRVRTAP